MRSLLYTLRVCNYLSCDTLCPIPPERSGGKKWVFSQNPASSQDTVDVIKKLVISPTSPSFAPYYSPLSVPSVHIRTINNHYHFQFLPFLHGQSLSLATLSLFRYVFFIPNPCIKYFDTIFSGLTNIFSFFSQKLTQLKVIYKYDNYQVCFNNLYFILKAKKNLMYRDIFSLTNLTVSKRALFCLIHIKNDPLSVPFTSVISIIDILQ